jgi:FkbM family methyltransferase
MKESLHKPFTRRLRGKLRARLLGPHAIGIVADARNGRFVVDPLDYNVSRSLLERGEYDWPQVRVLQGLLAATSRVVVVGAHIGSVLVPLAKAAHAGSVLAFEPSPRNRGLLEMNVALNALPHVRVCAAAAGDRAGTSGFAQNPTNSGGSKLSATGGSIEVRIATLDDEVPRDWSTIDLLVIDAEGFETQVLRGARRVLPRVRHLYVEFDPGQLVAQGSTVNEFAAEVSACFSTLQVLDQRGATRVAGDPREFLLAHADRPEARLDLLFTREALP